MVFGYCSFNVYLQELFFKTSKHLNSKVHDLVLIRVYISAIKRQCSIVKGVYAGNDGI